jgi:outer membrane protein
MKWLIPFAAGAVALSATAASADPLIGGDYRIRVGIGAQIVPQWPGARSDETIAFPKFSIARGDNPFKFSAQDDSFGIALVSTHGFSAGPVARLSSGRSVEEVGAPVGDVDRTFELGGFVQQFIGDSFRIRGELRKGIGGHKGLAGNAGVDFIARDGDKYLFSIGPRAGFADSRFMDTYFGVSPEAALASGLPEYHPAGTFRSVGVQSDFNYSLDGRWGVYGYARYKRLVGDAAKSPIVLELGSRDQFSAGAGISYTFGLHL